MIIKQKYLSDLSSLKLYGLPSLSDYQPQCDSYLFFSKDGRTKKTKSYSKLSAINYPEISFRTMKKTQVCSPELSLLQASKYLSFFQTVFLACEICMKEKPLRTKEQLIEYYENFPKGISTEKILIAMKYVMPGAFSPQEIKLGLNLCLPKKYGGYGLPTGQFNYRIDLSKNVRRLSKSEYCLGDIVWDSKKLIVEYNSKQYHPEHDFTKVSLDSNRRDDLESMGWKVLTCTDQVFSNRKELYKFAARVSRSLNFKHFDPTVRPIQYFQL